MTPETARSVCARHGSVLQKYSLGRFSRLTLASGEDILISMAPTSVRVFARRRFFGWLVPRTLAAKSISGWVPGFEKLGRLQRAGLQAMLLDGLTAILARTLSCEELALAWIALPDPLKAAHEECGWYS